VVVAMSARLWKCRNPRCPVQHGAVLGALKGRDALELAAGITQVRIHLDTRHVVVTCPHCGTDRIFRNGSVFLDRSRP
jgi:hypothetical protein